jgi:hypothetical protein
MPIEPTLRIPGLRIAARVLVEDRGARSAERRSVFLGAQQVAPVDAAPTVKVRSRLSFNSFSSAAEKVSSVCVWRGSVVGTPAVEKLVWNSTCLS